MTIGRLHDGFMMIFIYLTRRNNYLFQDRMTIGRLTLINTRARAF